MKFVLSFWIYSGPKDSPRRSVLCLTSAVNVFGPVSMTWRAGIAFAGNELGKVAACYQDRIK